MAMFEAGEAAIFNCASFCIPDLLGAYGEDFVNEDVGFLPISYSEPVVWVYGADDWGAYLPKTGDSENEAAARAYVEFALGDGYQLYLTEMLEPSRYPSWHSVPDPDALSIPVQEGQSAPNTYPAVAGLDPLLPCLPAVGEIFTFISEMYVGQKTALEVAESIDVAFQQICKDLGVPGFDGS